MVRADPKAGGYVFAPVAALQGFQDLGIALQYFLLALRLVLPKPLQRISEVFTQSHQPSSGPLYAACQLLCQRHLRRLGAPQAQHFFGNGLPWLVLVTVPQYSQLRWSAMRAGATS